MGICLRMMGGMHLFEGFNYSGSDFSAFRGLKIE